MAVNGLSVTSRAGGWRQRGFRDGEAGKEARPPNDPADRESYMQGYRSGARVRAQAAA